MNCTYPVEESILMDYVPKNTRARWKSLESSRSSAGAAPHSRAAYWRINTATRGLLPLRSVLQASGRACATRGCWASSRARRRLSSTQDDRRDPIWSRRPGALLLGEEREKVDDAEAPGP